MCASYDRYKSDFLQFLEKTTTLNEPVDSSILMAMQTGAPQALTGVPRRAAQENDAIPRVAPKWLKHDRHVRRTSLISLLSGVIQSLDRPEGRSNSHQPTLRILFIIHWSLGSLSP